MSSENKSLENAVIVDMENQDLNESIYKAFEQARILSLIEKAQEIFVHIPLGATFFRDGVPLEATYLNVELAEAIISVCSRKPITFYEAPATAHRDVKILFEKLGYHELIEKHSQTRVLFLEKDTMDKNDIVSLNYGFDYPPIELPGFLFDKKNLIISFSNPKAPFSEKVAGFKGLPFSLSGKSLIMGSTLFSKKNLLHLAFSDIGLGLKGYIVDALDKIYEAGVTCVGINGGRYAGAMIENVKVTPVEWNLLTISKNTAITDAVSAELMGFNPQEIGYFIELAQKGLIPFDLSTIPVIEMGNGRARIESQLKENNPFLSQKSPISTRQWIFGLLSQMSFKDRLHIMRKIMPSVLRYQIGKKKKQPN
jgi:hypothetical protein